MDEPQPGPSATSSGPSFSPHSLSGRLRISAVAPVAPRKAKTPAQLVREAAAKARRELKQAELLVEIQSMEAELATVKAAK